MVAKVISGQLGMATPFGELLGASDAQMNAELDDYVALGVDWLRIDIHWTDVQKSANGSFNWNQYDKVFNAAAARGIEIVAILNNTPSWVDSSYSTTASHTAYANFAKAAAQHFGDLVNYWEIFNEPNLAGINPVNYTKMLKAAYTAIKSVSPDDMVITGGTAAVPSTTNGLYGAAEYMQTMYANGAKGYFDAVGFHPYTFPLTPSDNSAWNGWEIMEKGIRGSMVANGDSDKQIWMTELGSPTAGGASKLNADLQETVLREAVDIARDHDWAGPIMWYSYQDRGGSGSDTENWFGLIGPNGAKKDAYHLFKELANSDNGDPAVSQPDDRPNTGNGGGISNPPTENTGPTLHKFTNGEGNFVITNFKAGDKIDLSAIDANTLVSGNQDFNFIASNWLSKTGDLGVYHDQTNGFTYLEGTIDGDTAKEFSIKITGIHNLNKDSLILSSIATPPSTVPPVVVETPGVHKFTNGEGSFTLTNFKDGDKIDLSTIDANILISGNQDFKFVESNWLSKTGDLGVYYDRVNGYTYLEGTTDGDTAKEFSVKISGIHTLTKDSLILSSSAAPSVPSEPVPTAGTVYKITQATGVRKIADFEAGDKIDLSAIDANRSKAGMQDFTLIGSDWLEEAGDLGVYHNASANKTYVQGDTNGDGTFDFSLELSGIHAMTQNDFIF